MSYETAYLADPMRANVENYLSNLRTLKSPGKINEAKGQGVVSALHHTIKVCKESSSTARYLADLKQSEVPAIAATSIKRRQAGVLLSDYPSNKESTQAISDLKALAQSIRDTKRLLEAQDKLMGVMRECMRAESEFCKETGKCQAEYEAQLKEIHAKMYQDGAKPAFRYYMAPGTQDDRDCFPNVFQRFNHESSATLESTSQKIAALNDFKEKLEKQLQDGVVNADQNQLDKLLQEVPGVIQMVSEPALTVETGPEPEARELSQTSPAAALQYGVEHLDQMIRLIQFYEDSYEYEDTEVLTDSEIDEQFPLVSYGYVYSEKTLTESQSNELAERIKSFEKYCAFLQQRCQKRREGLGILAGSLDRDVSMFQEVLKAEMEGTNAVRDELKLVNGFRQAGIAERKDIVEMTTTVVNEALDSDTRAKEALKNVKQEIMDLLVKAKEEAEKEEAEKAVIVDNLPIEEETVDETAVEEPATEATIATTIETTVDASVRATVDVENSVENKTTEIKPVDDSTETATTTVATATEAVSSAGKSRIKVLIDCFEKLIKVFKQKSM